jgi:hypothetical protein
MQFMVEILLTGTNFLVPVFLPPTNSTKKELAK